MEQQQQEQRQQEPRPPPSSSSEPFADHQHAFRFGSSLIPPSLTPRQDARRRWSQQQRERQPVSREVIGYAVGMHTSPVTIAPQDAAGAAQADDQGLLLEHTLYVIENSLVSYDVRGRRTRSSTRGGEQQEARVIYQQRVLLRVAAAPAPAARQITGADNHNTTTLISYGDGRSEHLAVMQAELVTVEAMADDLQEDAALLLAEQVARLAGQIVREEDPRSQRVAMFLMHVRLMGQVAAATGADDHDQADEEAAQVDADYTDEFHATAAPGRNPPTSMAVIDALPELQFTPDRHHGDHKDQEQWISSSMADNNCCVCSEELLHAVCTQLPCKHLFHKKCIAQWLHMRNTCPLCRFELPTDNPTYEANKRRRLD